MRLTRKGILIGAGAALVLVAGALAGTSLLSNDGAGGADAPEDVTAFGNLSELDALDAGRVSGDEPAPGAPPYEAYADDGSVLLSSSAGDEASALPDLLDRKIVQSTSIDLKVEEVSRDFQEIIRVAEINGGFVSSSSFSVVDERQVADLTIRVPATRYQAVLAELRDMGEVATESSDAGDVTEEYTDLQARLRTLEATEQRYLDLLARADTVNDILTVQDRLDSVRGQIEQVQGRINLLDHLVDLATITIHLRPLTPAVDAGGGGGIHPLNAAASAWDHSLESLRGLAAASLIVAVFSIWIVPPLAALGFGARWWLARRPRPAGGSI